MQENFELNGLKIEVIVVGMVSTNCYILSNVKTKQAVIVDPGDQGARIVSAAKQKGYDVEAVLLTHGHFDHITGVQHIRDLINVPVYALEEEKELLENDNLNCSRQFGRPVTVGNVTYLKAGTVWKAAGFDVKIIATPGHTKGSCCYYFEQNDCLMSGDTLFFESMGRTDFPTGNSQKILESLNKLMELPDSVHVFSGHGNPTTIKYERANNPFINGFM